MNAAIKPEMVPGFDGQTPEFVAARGFEVRDRLTGKVIRTVPDGPQNVNCDRIEHLFSYHKIGKRQYEAAQRLMQDEYLRTAERPPPPDILKGCAGEASSMSFVDLKIMAGRRVMRARQSFTGWRSRMWPMVVAVALKNCSPEKASSLLHMDKRNGMEVLRVGLHLLADHYGYEEDA